MSNVDLDDLIGIPFLNRGRNIDGSDCWGVVMLIFARYGIQLPDIRVSCFDSLKINQKIDDQRTYWKRLDEPEEPCLVVLRTDPNNPRWCCHNGVYVGDGYFLHTFLKRNSCKEPINHIFWNKKIEGFYRYVGNNNS